MNYDDKGPERVARADCPRAQLGWFANQTLPVRERASVEAHLRDCADCRQELSDWTRLRQGLQVTAEATPPPGTELFGRIEAELEIRGVYWQWQQRMMQGRDWLGIFLEHCLAQCRLIRNDLWLMPLLLIPLGVALVLSHQDGSWSWWADFEAFAAALMVALGMAFLYSQESDPARELTLVALVSPQRTLSLRCGIIFVYDLLVNLAGVLPFMLVDKAITPTWFVMNWLAPLCCLAAISLLLSIAINPQAAIFVCALLWALRLFSFFAPLNGLTTWQAEYESFWHQGPLLFVCAALLFLLALFCLERRERFSW